MTGSRSGQEEGKSPSRRRLFRLSMVASLDAELCTAEDLRALETGVLQWALSAAQEGLRVLLEQGDTALLEEIRASGMDWAVVGSRRTTLLTLFGEVELNRRLYRTADGRITLRWTSGLGSRATIGSAPACGSRWRTFAACCRFAWWRTCSGAC